MDADSISTSQLLDARGEELFDAAELHLVDAEEQELVDVVQPQAVDVRKKQLVHIGEQHQVDAKVAVTASTSSGPSAYRQSVVHDTALRTVSTSTGRYRSACLPSTRWLRDVVRLCAGATCSAPALLSATSGAHLRSLRAQRSSWITGGGKGSRSGR